MSDKKDWKKFKDENLAKEFADNDLDEDSIEDDAEEVKTIEHASYAELEEKLNLTEKKMHENWETATRAMAELENVRRRAERDVSNAHKYGLEKLIDGVLPVIDSLEQALLLAKNAENSSLYEGLALTMKLFLDVLSKWNVVQINPLGEMFNPDCHEAMSMQAADDVKPNTVLLVFQQGYKLNDRVIRPARVIVSK
jgi:molecular chaperone GrpE